MFLYTDNGQTKKYINKNDEENDCNGLRHDSGRDNGSGSARHKRKSGL